MHRTQRLSLLLTLILLTLIGYAPALAQDKTLVWDRYDVNIRVQPNGDMLVEEIQEIDFTSGTFRFGFAAIPLDRVENLADVSVAEIMPDGSVRDYRPNSSGEYGFTTARNDNNELEITWYFPPAANSTHTYVLRYRVEGGLRIYPDGDQVWWKAIPPDHNFPIRSATITVTPPQTFAKEQLVVDAYGAPVDNISYTDRGAVVFTARDIPADQELEVRVQFPHGVVTAEPPAWQAADDRVRTWGPVIGLFAGALGLALLFGGPVAVYALWYTRGRDDESALAPEYISEPPGDLPAGLVGTLVDEHADVKDVIASIFDLAERGALRMEEKQNTGSLGMSRDFIFHLTDNSQTRFSHEEKLLDGIFGQKRQERRLRDLHNKFYSVIPTIQNQLYREVVEQGFFDRSPETTRQKWLALAIAGLVVSFGSAFCLLVLLGHYSPAVACPGLGLMTAAIMLMVISRHMPRKTAKGAEEAAKWLAFKKYLQNIEEYSDMEAVKDKFQTYLPYAVAFGLEKRLIKKFSALENAPAPTWWGPVFIPHGGYYGYPGQRGSPVESSGGPPGPLAGEGGGVPNLSDMSEGLGTSLATMSAGLGSLLNSASSTLTSQPAPKSTSSGGGWSGGGFSGGGSFGGGGGGGGSRGFG